MGRTYPRPTTVAAAALKRRHTAVPKAGASESASLLATMPVFGGDGRGKMGRFRLSRMARLATMAG